MHPYVWIPLGAMLAASALAGAIFASGRRLRASWAVAALLLNNAGWALCEVLAQISTDALAEITWLRATTFFGLSFGPLGLVVLAELRPSLRDEMMRQAKVAFAAVVMLSAIALTTPWVVSATTQHTPLGGSLFEFGPMGPFVLIVCCAVPLYAVFRFLSSRDSADATRLQGPTLVLGLTAVLLIGVAVTTDAVLPMLGVDMPRLATLCTVVVGAQLWVVYSRSEEALVSDSGFARAILDNLPDGVAVLERDGLVRATNETLARFIEAEPSELIGQSIEDLLGASVHDLASGLEERELLLCRAKGEPIPVAVSSVPIHDRQGGVIGLVVLARDLRAVVGLRQQLVVSGRLAALGELAAGIAHEVNNPIAFILANLNELRRHRSAVEAHLLESDVRFEPPLGLLEAGDESIDEAQAQIRCVAEIVQEVSAFVRVGTGVREPCDLNELIDSVLRLATLQRESGAAIERDQSPLPDVVCASQGMKQVFLSLIRRAMAAAGHAGRVRVCTGVEGANAIVRIEDDGETLPMSGPQNLLFDLFDPAVGEWGGLELGLSHQLIHEQDGEMSVRPMPSGGTCVRVVMPLAVDPSPGQVDGEDRLA